MKIPILTGIYTDGRADYRVSYPVNMVAVAVDNGIDKSYLRPAEGIVLSGLGTGIDRGGINWRDNCYRVMGTTLIRINENNTFTSIGEVGGIGQVSFTYGFDRLAIASGNKLYYYNGTTLTQVTDPDLGNVIDVVWVDGYFMTTDGTSLVVTDLNDPMQVNPLKYGSSEAAPDPVVALRKLRNEVYAVNRYTIEVFDNAGGNLFPFNRVEGAQVQRGALSKTCVTVFNDVLVFLGGAYNESPSLWTTNGANSIRLATSEIDNILGEYTDAQLAAALVESRITNGHSYLYVHLENKTLLYDADVSTRLGRPVWSILTTSKVGINLYRARGFVYCYNKWLCGDPASAQYGYLSSDIMSHYNQLVQWQFSTVIMYADGKGAIFHSLELQGLTGRVALGAKPVIATSYSTDGLIWSQDKVISMGKIGDRNKRLQWRGMGKMDSTRIQRFCGNSDGYASFSALIAEIEPLNV